jgi:hypothetical protein
MRQSAGSHLQDQANLVGVPGVLGGAAGLDKHIHIVDRVFGLAQDAIDIIL